MNKTKLCPESSRLKQIIVGSQPADGSLESHIKQCKSCRKRLNELSNLDTLTDYRKHARNLNNASFALGPPMKADDLGSLAGFAIEQKIGSGAMGVVYRGRDRELDRVVAVKVLARGSSFESDARFTRESKAVAALSHPNIVPVLSAGRAEDGRPYLVMPLIRGSTLKDQLAKGPLTSREAATKVRQIALALSEAHASGLIHRDIKPANILLDETDSMAKLTDFGLVRSTRDETLTQRDVICGSPEFMAPEQASHPEARDKRSDIYSLGITLYQCLTGTLPFRGRPLEVLEQHRELAPLTPSRLNNAIDRQLDTICLKSIEKEPARRYQSADQFAEDLQNYLEGRPILARPSNRVDQAIRWAKRNTVVATLGAAFLLALCGGTTVATWGWLTAQKNLDAARANFATATELLVNKEYFAQRLAYIPGQEETSLELYRQLSDEIEQLSKLQNSDLKTTFIAADMFRHRAEVEYLLGDVDRAIESCVKSGELYETVKRAPNHLQKLGISSDEASADTLANQIAANLITQGECMFVSGQPEQAHTAYSNALEILMDLDDRQSLENKSEATRRNIALIHVLQGNVWRDLNKNDVKALESFRRASDIIEQAPFQFANIDAESQESPPANTINELGAKHIEAFVSHFLGRQLVKMAMALPDKNDAKQRMVEGQQHLKHALQLRYDISRMDVAPARLLRDVAVTLSELAAFDMENENYEQAGQQLDEAIEIFDSIRAASSRFEPQLRLAQALDLRSKLPLGSNETREKDATRAQELAESLIETCPASWEARQTLGAINLQTDQATGS